MATTERLLPAKKRKKRSGDSEVPRKSKKPHLGEANDAKGNITALESEILGSQNYNKINDLLQYLIKPQDDIDASETASVALCTVFSELFGLGKFSTEDVPHIQDNVVSRWLAKKYKQYYHLLLQALPQDSQFSSRLLMVLVKQEILVSKSNQIWKNGLYPQVVKAILTDDSLSFERFAKDSILPFKDATVYACRTIASVSDLSDAAIDQAVSFLLSLEFPAAEKEFEDTYLAELPPKSERKHPSDTTYKKAVQDAWLAIMRHQLSEQQRKRILDQITTSIATWFSKPELLTDFLVDSFNAGGALSLTALSGMFHLMQHRNLDYPQFYTKVYSLLDRNILHSKQRSRFLRLLDIFLASTHLPAALVASFMKRLSRLCLHAPPAAIIAIVPWIYNMIQTHAVCALMIHRSTPATSTDHEKTQGQDPFLAHEPDPLHTKALESSLWEIHSLAGHYHPNTATLATIIAKPFTKRSYKLDDFWNHSYEGMLAAELGRTLKREPVVQFQIPKRIFIREDDENVGGEEDEKGEDEKGEDEPLALVRRVWAFDDGHLERSVEVD